MRMPAARFPLALPVEETEVLLLNAQGDPGQVCGEIALASPYLAQGYWRRPELTAAAFLADPKARAQDLPHRRPWPAAAQWPD